MGGAQVLPNSLYEIGSSLKRKVFIVTDGCSGVGFNIAKDLASKHATVALTFRNADRVDAAVNAIKTHQQDADVHGFTLDLSSFLSIEDFSASFECQFDGLDGIFINSSVPTTTQSKTEQGFEVTLGTNVFGVAYLTTQLLPLLKENPNGGQIVFVSSTSTNKTLSESFKVLHRRSESYRCDAMLRALLGGEQFNADDITFNTNEMSKLLISMYAFELQQKLLENGHNNIKVCVSEATTPHSRRSKGLLSHLTDLVGTVPSNDNHIGILSNANTICAATVEDTSMKYRGLTFSSGRKVTHFKRRNKVCTPENCVLAFDAINTVIKSKGFAGFE